MPVSPAKMYALEAVSAWIGPVSFGGGFSTDGGIDFEYLEEDMEVTVGSTGLTVFVLSSNTCAIANVKLNPQSVAYRRLFEQLEIQRAAMRATFVIPPLNFLMVDPTNGDEVGDPNAVFIAKPTLSKNKGLHEAVYRIALPNGRDQISVGLLNQVGG